MLLIFLEENQMGMPIITPSNTTRCQAITDIIESVALEQTALSHILNAEGEKIQKVVSISIPKFVVNIVFAPFNSVFCILLVVTYYRHKGDITSQFCS